MNKIKWIKELVLEEEDNQSDSNQDFLFKPFPQRRLEEETLSFLKDLKLAFIEVTSMFNQMKGSTLGNLKIYGISKTKANFMLFRNQLKLNFVMKQPGVIAISLHSIENFTSQERTSSQVVPQEPTEYLKAQPGAFEEFHWFCRGYTINTDFLVRYYLSRFVRQSRNKNQNFDQSEKNLKILSRSP